VTKDQLRNLKRGDIVRSFSSKITYMVTSNYGDRSTAVRTVELTNPGEWEVIYEAETQDYCALVEAETSHLSAALEKNQKSVSVEPIGSITKTENDMCTSPNVTVNREAYLALELGKYDIFLGPQQYIQGQSCTCDIVSVNFETRIVTIRLDESAPITFGKYRLVRVADV